MSNARPRLAEIVGQGAPCELSLRMTPRGPVLCLRGESSDLLLRETVDAMRERGPRAVVVEIPGCGHAPALNTPEQFALIERFLNG